MLPANPNPHLKTPHPIRDCLWTSMRPVTHYHLSPLLTPRPNPASTLLSSINPGKLDRALRRSNPTASLDPSLYSPLLQRCIDSNAQQQGRALHLHLLINGHTPDLHLSTKLIIFYSKMGDVGSARKVFDRMPQRSTVSWTAMISGYSQNGYSEEALDTFSSMRRTGCKANQFTYGSALRACTSLGCISIGEQVHGCVTKGRFAGDLFVQSTLVDLHLKCGSVEDARGLFGRMEQRDVVSWNLVIGGHMVRGFRDDAFELFRSMLRDGLKPDHFTFVSVLSGCGGVRTLSNVMQFHVSVLKMGHGNKCMVTGSLIDAYARSRCMSSARLLYDSMHQNDLISCTALITRYSQGKNYSVEALKLFHEINRMGMRVDEVILCSILNVCANVASISFGRQIHALVLKNQPNYDVALGNALIDMYAKCGEIEDAHQAFDVMRCRNVISWTSLISGYGKNGYGDVAIALFGKMEDEGMKPNDVTFLTLLSSCSHSGLTSKGIDYFSTMVSKYQIHPRAEHYSCVVDLLARGGRLEEAYHFICKMGVKLNASLWGAMLGACRMYGNTSLGEVAARYLFYLDPDNSVNYVVLANIYASAGLWEDACKTRKLMENRHVKKDAGSSLILLPRKLISFQAI